MNVLKLALTKVSWATEAKMEPCNRLASQYLESLDTEFVLKPIICKSIYLG